MNNVSSLRRVLIAFLAVALVSCSGGDSEETGETYTPLAKVNFQTEDAAVPTGYLRDFGQGYDEARGYGWVSATDHNPVDNSTGGRERNVIDEQRLDTFVHMQPEGADYRWEFAVPNGTYRLTVGAGDPGTEYDSTHSVRAEGVRVIGPYEPDRLDSQQVITKSVKVTDGRITLDAKGGTNTKIAYVEISVVNANGPSFKTLSPGAAETGVSTTASVIFTPGVAVNPETVNAKTLVVTDPDGTKLKGSYNSDAAGGVVNFTPADNFQANTRYRVVVKGMKDDDGKSFPHLDYSFTTGSGGTEAAPIAFTKKKLGDIPGATTLAVGPDNALYVGTAMGEIFKYRLDDAGSVVGKRTELAKDWRNERTITGIEFDPKSTASDMKLYVSHGYLGVENAPNWTGSVSVLTKTTKDFDTKRDVIVGLPRSSKDHLNNGIKFGPDGKLYIAQGSINGYGAPDAEWGQREESKLSGAVLQADVNAISDTLDVKTAEGGNYDPDAAGALVKVYAGGTRNPYDLLWHSNGSLYSAVNESAGGNTPAGPGGNPRALEALPAGHDYFAKIIEGKYYGHPNPARGDYTLNGGNPTSGADFFEVSQYPVGTQPQGDWQRPLHDFGLHRSPNGLCEYTSSILGDKYKGMIVQTEFSSGDDLLGIFLDGDGNVSNVQQIARGFNNPVDVTMGPGGVLYVAEFGSQSDMKGGELTMLAPIP